VLEHTGGLQSTELHLTWNPGARRLPQPVLSTTGAGVHTYELESVSNGFFRVSVSVTYSQALGALRARVNPDATPANVGSVYAWGAQLELGSRMTPYQRVLGRHSFEPPHVENAPDPIGLAETLTVVTPNDDVESLLTALPATLYEVRLVDSDPNGLQARTTKLVTLARGSLIVFGRAGEAKIPRGGSSCLDLNARYVSATSLFQRVIATDGTRSVIYEPYLTGRVQPYKAKKGDVPAGVELWSNYRGRAFGARTKDDPHAWFASAVENLFDWDYFTPPSRSDKAVFSATSRAGLAPDIINAIIAYDDKRLILGCDSTLWYLEGDPLSDRAEWQRIPTTIGIAFGDKSWCQDDRGTLYAFGSRGGLYRFYPGTLPEPLSENSIQRRLQNIDLERYYVELVWNDTEQGLNVYVIPFGVHDQVVKHFYWGRAFDEWREDEFATPSVQPLSTTILDGDLSNDRRVLIVNGDQRVLQWDATERTDDGQLIRWKELIGPYDGGNDRELRAEDLTVLLSEDSDGCRYEVYAASTADNIGPIREQGLLMPGRNSRKTARVCGAKVWVLLGTDVLGQRAAFEEGGLHVALAGRARV
jgi:hypothetical protein